MGSNPANVFVTPYCVEKISHENGVARHLGSVLAYLNGSVHTLSLAPDPHKAGWYIGIPPEGRYIFHLRPPIEPFSKYKVDYVAVRVDQYSRATGEVKTVEVHWV